MHKVELFHAIVYRPHIYTRTPSRTIPPKPRQRPVLLFYRLGKSLYHVWKALRDGDVSENLIEAVKSKYKTSADM